MSTQTDERPNARASEQRMGFVSRPRFEDYRETFIVAETFGHRLSAFDIAAGGSLSGRRVFAELGDGVPEGICLDAEGAVWVSSPFTHEFLRVWQGGAVAERISLSGSGKLAMACVLGGEDRRTLFLLTAETTMEELSRGNSKGYIETVRVEVPGAGIP